MKALLVLLRSEPALTGGVVSAAVALASSFGLGFTSDQTGALSALVAAAVAVLVRGKVIPHVPPANLPPK